MPAAARSSATLRSTGMLGAFMVSAGTWRASSGRRASWETEAKPYDAKDPKLVRQLRPHIHHAAGSKAGTFGARRSGSNVCCRIIWERPAGASTGTIAIV